jgi:hypothetical protein
MKVFEISTIARPAKGRFGSFAALGADDSVHDYLDVAGGEFSGAPFSKKWKRIKLYVADPKHPRPDFYQFGGGCGEFVCNQRAREITGEALEMAGELLPVSVEDEKGPHWLYNITNCVNCVDRKRSRWNSNTRLLERPAFHAGRFGEESLFKIPDDNGASMFCLERTGDPDDGEFKAVVESAGLTGLEFKLVWSDSKRT